MEREREADELREQQLEREITEEHLAVTSDDEDESAQHARRAEKARYLREKLEEREAAEGEATEGEATGGR